MYQAIIPEDQTILDPNDPDKEIIDDPIYDDEVTEDLPEEEQGDPVPPS